MTVLTLFCFGVEVGGHQVALLFFERPDVPVHLAYRGTSLIRNSAPLGPYSRTMPRPLWWS